MNRTPEEILESTAGHPLDAMYQYANQQTKSLREQLAKERALRKELVEVLDHFYSRGYIHGINYDYKRKIESLLQQAKLLDDKEVK